MINVYNESVICDWAEMRGYRFLISASYPYPLKTIRIRILSVQTSLTGVRILSVSVLLTESKKIFPTFSTVDLLVVIHVTACACLARLWRTFKGVVGEASVADTDAYTADDFAAFFKDKVEAVRESTAATPLYDVPYRLTPTIAEWSIVTSEEVEKLIGSALNKTCQLDPAPTWLVKDMHELLSVVTIHLLAVQQITHYWVLPAGFQGSCCLTAPEEKRA